uniref:Uncharacterized protein n=1 Tax=Avena sativa TaxID=4498 RepID=A0ACD5VZB8_AVESA
MASPRTVAIAFVLLVLVAASSPSSVAGARMMPADDDDRQGRVTGDGETAVPESTTGTSSSSLQEALVQRPPLPLPKSMPMSPPTMKTKAVFQRRSSRMLGSVPSPGVGH